MLMSAMKTGSPWTGLRWYHASAPAMIRLLEMIGSRIEFNQCVQVYLLFYECVATPLGGGSSSSLRQPTDHTILHFVGERIRWSAAAEIADTTLESIIDALTTHWIQLHGQPELMMWYGERAMVSIEVLQWASRIKMQLVSRAKHTKAWVAERHTEILRTALHNCQTQLPVEEHD